MEIKARADKHVEDKTSVIRVKFPDAKNRKIIHSCDFAIFQDIIDDVGKSSRKYCHKYDNGSYGWTTRGGKNDNADSKMKWLENNIGDNGNTNYDYYYLKGCSLIGNLRDEYLKLKNARWLRFVCVNRRMLLDRTPCWS